jgi:hypothetical protein
MLIVQLIRMNVPFRFLIKHDFSLPKASKSGFREAINVHVKLVPLFLAKNSNINYVHKHIKILPFFGSEKQISLTGKALMCLKNPSGRRTTSTTSTTAATTTTTTATHLEKLQKISSAD